MNALPLFFSLLFFVAFAICFFFGVYILSINIDEKKNRVFFILCLALCIWSFAFSVANSAPDYGTALFWRRVAAFGWGSMYSILLHFIFILTEKKWIMKKVWACLLLYFPAAVVIFAFSLYGDLAAGQYNLINTSTGWINISVNNFWDWCFNIYYFGFTIAGVGMIWHWGRSSPDREKKKQAYLLTASFAIALLVGSMTDIIMNTYLPVTIPQLAPVIILIPISTIFYAIKRYGFMVPDEISKPPKTGEILSETTRKKFYQYLSLSFIFGSMLAFVSSYFFNQALLGSALSFSFSLLLFSIAIQIIQRLKLKEEHKDTITIVIVAISIPFIALSVIDYACISVWAVPFAFVILSVVFSKRRMIILLTISIILTQIIIWLKTPEVNVQIGRADHLVRIGIFGIVIWLTFYVNRVYIERLKENEDQIRSQKIISQISTDFVTVSATNLDEKINRMLQMSGKYYQVDRASLLIISPDKKKLAYTHEWCNKGVESAIGVVEDLAADAFPWWAGQMKNNGIVHIPEVDLLPPEAGEEKKILKKYRISSLISVPVTDKGRVLGLLLFTPLRFAGGRRDVHLNMLTILANLLADALAKVDAEKEINYMAYYDPLTGLPNRALLKNRLAQAIHLARRTEKLLGVMFLDLDYFKSVNDTMGHEGGDELLKQVARKLSGCVRKYDTVSRFGGDEFLILLVQIPRIESIHSIAEKIMKVFEQPIIVQGQEFFITASAGVAVFPWDGEEAETLLKNADLAMYSSKDRGRNRYTLCSPAMKEDIFKKMQLTNSLYRAQERNELMLHYQPQVSLATKKIIGLEALIRWDHPQMGIISPEVFIPLAEQAGLINPIGEWVLRTACRQNMAWQDLGLPPVRMAVNLSVAQFRNPNLVSIIDGILGETGLNPAYLELEITESIIIKEADYIIRVLSDLKKLGVTIAIDDFGTEYSSLSRLKMLPIDRIKMAMQFVQGISDSNKDEAILKVIIHLARSLELKVIAEGVETEAQLEFLSRRMCDEIQGYYFYKPMPAEEIETILRMS